jgi:hypothetical protein
MDMGNKSKLGNDIADGRGRSKSAKKTGKIDEKCNSAGRITHNSKGKSCF